MCQEVVEIVKSMDLKSVESQLILQCAPLITGIRFSNLFMIESINDKTVGLALKHSGISYYKLGQFKGRTAFLLYRRKELERYFNNPMAKDVLEKVGYHDHSFADILKSFKQRYQTYMLNQGEDFPHEMGLLLGYPVEDVKGFIENDGRNSLFSGYWKVYGNVEHKKAIFKQYDSSKEKLIQLFASNVDFKSILKIYNSNISQQKAAV